MNIRQLESKYNLEIDWGSLEFERSVRVQSASKRITKEQYDRAKQNGGYITREDEDKIFTVAELLGYGVYSPIVHESGDGYYVHYYIGSSCD